MTHIRRISSWTYISALSIVRLWVPMLCVGTLSGDDCYAETMADSCQYSKVLLGILNLKLET